MSTLLLVGGACAIAPVLAPVLAGAQERSEAIEIRGQVPTPQVVTVRPREIPAYDRQVLVPNFFDRHFWSSILPGYQLVPSRVVTGESPIDSLAMPSDSLMLTAPVPRLLAPDTPAAPPAPGAPGDTTRTTPPLPGQSPPASVDSPERVPARPTRGATGTASARIRVSNLNATR
ncbi:MAG: hypothetical protein ACRENI_13095 [Gemmatimonadaceae bacterium]